MTYNPGSSPENRHPVDLKLERIGIKPPAGKKFIGLINEGDPKALIGTPFYLINADVESQRAEGEASLWLNNHLIKDQPALFNVNEFNVKGRDVLRISQGEFNSKAVSWLTSLGIDQASSDPGLLIQKLAQGVPEQAFVKIGSEENLHPDVVKAALSNFMVGSLNKKISQELNLDNDSQEGLISYLSRVAIEADSSKAVLEERNSKDSYARTYAELFPNPRVLTSLIEEQGYRSLLILYKDKIQEIQSKYGVDPVDVTQNQEVVLEESKAKNEAMQEYDAISGHTISEIDPSKLSDQERQGFNKFAELFKVQADYFRRDENFHPDLALFAFQLALRAEVLGEGKPLLEDPVVSLENGSVDYWTDEVQESNQRIDEFFGHLGFDGLKEIVSAEKISVIGEEGQVMEGKKISSLDELNVGEGLKVVFQSGPHQNQLTQGINGGVTYAMSINRASSKHFSIDMHALFGKVVA